MAPIGPQLSGQPDSAYTVAKPYAQNRFPDARRLAIPPPNIDYVGGKPTLDCFADGESDVPSYGSTEYGNPVFMQSLLACSSRSISHSMLSWQYEMRRTAQKILPFLLLGPSTAAQDADFIRTEGVTMLISVRSALSARARPNYLNPSLYASGANINTLMLNLDTPYDLITCLPKTIKEMNDHLEESCNCLPLESVKDIRSKILVFCESGNERSTALVAAYIMVIYGMDVVGAIQLIQSQRFCIAPDDGMKGMLSNFGDILKAKRDVDAQRSQGYSETVAKRTYEDYDSDEEMGDREDWESDRKDWVPFGDQNG